MAIDLEEAVRSVDSIFLSIVEKKRTEKRDLDRNERVTLYNLIL
jgi:hypothetical protein